MSRRRSVATSVSALVATLAPEVRSQTLGRALLTSLKTAAGSHNPERYGSVYFKTNLRVLQVFPAKIESPPCL